MRKFALATAAAVALLFTAPSFTGVTSPAEAQTVVKKKIVIKHGDRGRHMGRYGDRGRHMGRHHGGNKVVIIKRGGHHGSKTIIKKKITHG